MVHLIQAFQNALAGSTYDCHTRQATQSASAGKNSISLRPASILYNADSLRLDTKFCLRDADYVACPLWLCLPCVAFMHLQAASASVR